MRSMFFFHWIRRTFFALCSAVLVLLLCTIFLCRSSYPVKWIGVLAMTAFLFGACICGLSNRNEKKETKFFLSILAYFSYIAVWLSLHVFFFASVKSWYIQLLWIVIGGICCVASCCLGSKRAVSKTRSHVRYRHKSRHIRR